MPNLAAIQPPSIVYKPAFQGQTQAKPVITKTPLVISILSDKLERPWGLSLLPDGRFLISQKGGTMVILSKDGIIGKKISHISKVGPSGKGEILDVTIDPDFENNKMIYWAYTEFQDTRSLLAIAKGKLSTDENKIENITVIYRATNAYSGYLQYGSRFIFDKNGNLFVTMGDHSGFDTRMQAQYLNSSLGKILHITKFGEAVANGPFVNQINARPEIYAVGIRNAYGLAINPQTGDLWEAEFGPKGGDEINIIKPGKNYGWPVITYGTEYNGEKVGDGIAQKDGMEQPIYYWNPSISPGCIAFYNSSVIEEWKGNLFVGALSGSQVIRLIIKNDKIVGEEKLLADKGERFRDMAIGKDGAIYTVTDGGKLYRIGKK
ncbi:PQQ-dependent sugar dehydrogenase [Pedobacter changchengzhani]|uniref:PQQ-dependent sugar dehydrogenase n=1 Tax=Pedobacter changchengzhani TaxID=2529274 RepID=UPI001FB6D895|nr:PQQ-dependent sugar dehydrogenase [Pedobacter changchengzhani]